MHDASHFHHLLGVLVALLVGTRLLGELAQRVGQPSVLGELLAGVLLGASVLGILDPTDPVIAALSELGVLILLFEIGLHTDVRALAKVGGTAGMVGIVGVVLPFGLGYLVATAFGVPTIAAVVCGAALTATSIGISARVLADLGQLESPEGRIVLGAAVLDDVIGLVILSVVSGVVGGAAVTVGGASLTAGVAIGFVLAAVVVGGVVVPPLFRSAAARVRTSGALLVLGLALAFGMAYLAESAGSALIIGAFAAGLVLHPTPQRQEIERATTTLGYFFVPVFFASVGAAVDVRTLADGGTLAVGGALIAAAIVGKFAAGYAPVWFKGRKALIGVAMIPRGEVGLIFAQMGLATGALTRDLFSAVALMVMATTFIAPPLLARMAAGERGSSDDPYDDGVAGLVGGGPRTTAAIPHARPGQLDDGDIQDLVCGREAEDAPAGGRTRRPEG